MTSLSHTLATFFQLLRRDIYVAFKRGHIFAINLGLLYPVIYAFCFLYLQPHVLFEHNPTHNGSIVFIGMLLLLAFIVSFEPTIPLLFDLIGDRFIDYQRTLIDSRLVIIERIIFAGLFTFTLLMPFFPIAKLLFPHAFIIPNASWLSLAWIIFLGAFLTASYHLMAACIMTSPHQITRLWMRYSEAMTIFGGLFIPWHIIYKMSPLLAYLALLNPMLYITEGARQALLGTPEFFPLWICSLVMIATTVLFTIVACRMFKKRVDHI